MGETTPARLLICVDWGKVDEHTARVSRSKTRIHLDSECLRWTPLVTTVPNPYVEEEKEVCMLFVLYKYPLVCCSQVRIVIYRIYANTPRHRIIRAP